MAEAPQFSPDELDRLEDALESLEGIELDLLEDEAEHVRARLVDYRSILIASREALPLQDVPEGTLDQVLAIARDPGQDELAAAPVPAAAEAQSWWTRFRRSLIIPALAVAGSAALILIIVKPTLEDAPVVAEKSAPAQQAQGKMGGDGAPAAAAESQRSEPGEPPPPAAAAATPAEDAEAEDEDAEPIYEEIASTRSVTKEEAKDLSRTKGDASDKNPLGRSVVEGGEVSGSEDKPDDGKATPRWDLIAKGDRARTDGDCATARRHYEAALSDTDDRVQARANAGLGLCEAQQGRSSAADELYERARDLDPQINEFLDQEASPDTEAKAKPRPTKRSRKKSKRKAAPAENALDAFD